MEARKKIRLFFLTRSLGYGGSERQVVSLAKWLDKNRYEVTVCLFYDHGELRQDLLGQKGVAVVTLNKTGRWDVLGFAFRLARLFARQKPEVVYTMLPTPNIIGLACAGIASKAKVVCVGGASLPQGITQRRPVTGHCLFFGSGIIWILRPGDCEFQRRQG